MKPARAVVVCLLASAFALTAGAATEYTYTAETLAPAKKQGVVKAGSISWRCQGARCTATGPWAKPGVGACKALAQQIGEIRAYGHPKSQLSAAELRRCNAGVAASTQERKDQQQRSSQDRRDQQQRASQDSKDQQQRSPESKSTEPFRPQKIRTAALRVTGTGGTAALGAGFAPVKIRTARLTVTGTGATAAVGAAFEPRSLRTAPLTITGTGTP